MRKIILTPEQLECYKFIQRIPTPMIVFNTLVKGILAEHGLVALDNFTFEVKDNILLVSNTTTMGAYVSTY